jgi:hypothetical protein
VTGIASVGADGRMAGHAHRISQEIRCRIGMAVAALNARHRNVGWRGHAGRSGAVVAARAGGIGRSVAERSAEPGGGALVATLTWQGCGHVVRGLAQRLGAIVAAGARRRYSCMIHDGRAAKTHCALVAVSAWGSGDHVVGRLAKSERSVVTTGASCCRLSVIDEAHFAPRRREVAALAEIRRLRVRLHFSGSGRTVVAGETLLWCPVETPTDMA